MRCWSYKPKKTGESGMRYNKYPSLILCFLFFLIGCQNESFTPKPRGYFRISFPEKTYQVYNEDCPFHFEHPLYSEIKNDASEGAHPCWKNLDFPEFNARLHFSYFKIDNKDATLEALTNDAWNFAFKHTSKATAIDQRVINNESKNLYGIEYSIKGNTASNYQFYLTDSVNHYLRGALYFNEKPNLDSIQPVLSFIKEDLDHLIKTFAWK